jgi:CheY-like chemotaxis protein
MSTTRAGGGSSHVLVVDDDAGVRDVIEQALTSEGYIVHAVTDGQEALAKLRHQRVDLILLDVNMPNVDGWQVLEELRAAAGRQTAVVVMTAGYEAQDRALSSGAQGFLGKPFELDDLIGTVEAHVGLPVEGGAEEVARH